MNNASKTSIFFLQSGHTTSCEHQAIRLVDKEEGVILFLWAVLALLVALIMILLFSKIEGNIEFSPYPVKHQLHVTVKACWGMIQFRFASPFVDIDLIDRFVHKRPSKLIPHNLVWFVHRIFLLIHKFQYVRNHLVNSSLWVRHSLKKIVCEQFVCSTQFGVQEASRTAIYAGSIWLVKSTLTRWALKKFTLRTKPQLAVKPRYQEYHFSLQLRLLISIRVVHLLGVFLQFLYLLLRSKHRLQLLQVCWSSFGLFKN